MGDLYFMLFKKNKTFFILKHRIVSIIVSLQWAISFTAMCSGMNQQVSEVFEKLLFFIIVSILLTIDTFDFRF